MEDISLPIGCQRSLGHGEDAVYQGRPKSHGRGRTLGPDGKEIPVSLVYGQVELAANYSQQDCRLDRLLDGIEEEIYESKLPCTFLDICNSS